MKLMSNVRLLIGSLTFVGWICPAVFGEQGVPVEKEMLGRRVSVEIVLTNESARVQTCSVRLRQENPSGKTLRELVVDPRWTTLMIPAGGQQRLEVEGSIHPRAVKIVQECLVRGRNAEWVPAETGNVRILSSRISLVPARKMRAELFDRGRTGRGLALRKGRTHFFTVYSRSVWGQGMDVDPAEAFFSLESVSVEADFRPDASCGRSRLFSAANARVNSSGIDYFGVDWDPEKGELVARLTGLDGQKFIVRSSARLSAGRWNHLKVSFRAERELVVELDGRKIAAVSLKGYVPAPLGDPRKGVHVFGIGADANRARRVRRPSVEGAFSGVVDNLVVSSNGKTLARFDFEGDIDGVSDVADGRVEASLLADVSLYPGTRRSEFSRGYGEFDVLHYKNVPTEDDFAAARNLKREKRTMRSGDSMAFDLPEDAIPVYTEISNVSSEDLVAPFVRHPDEVDPRSWETISETLKVKDLGERQRADVAFRYALGAMDYFICHQALTAPGRSYGESACNLPLSNLNGYGFDLCGALNRVAVNLFAQSVGLAADVVNGYDHEYEQVYLRGRPRIYDLSAQTCYLSLEDDYPASLQDVDREPGIFTRYNDDASYNARLFKHGPRGNPPVAERGFFLTLKPGERFRYYRNNDGQLNDVWYGRPGYAPHPLRAPRPEGCDVGFAYRVNRFPPEAANAFVVYEGRRVEKEYRVDFIYTVTRGAYRAFDEDGNPLRLEISKDDRRTWKPLAADSDGWARPVYGVRSLSRYYIRAAGGSPAVFKAMTELQMNPRVLTGLARGGLSSYLFTTRDETRGIAEVTVAYAIPEGKIVIPEALNWGAVRGAERSLVAFDPDGGQKDISVIGGSQERVRLDFPLRELPYYTNLVLRTKTGDGRKVLTVLVGRGVQIRRVDRTLARQAAFSRKGERTRVDFNPVGRDFMLWNLTRVRGGLNSHEVHNRPLCYVDETAEASRRRLQPCGGGAGHGDLYKAAMGTPDGRADWHWSCPTQPGTEYPLDGPRVFTDGKQNHAVYEMKTDYPDQLEFKAVLVVPAGDFDFRGETIRLLQGLNYDPGLGEESKCL